MRIYTVHVRRPLGDPAHDVCLVKEGFCWPAFLFTTFWALGARLWLIALALLIVQAAVDAGLSILGIEPGMRVVASVAVAVIAGLVGNDLRRWTLVRRGFQQIAVVTGRDRDAAECRFWSQRPQLLSGVPR
ncbi:MAG: DUF2628 domain-containing protein [Rhodospirillales bacterium]|nr:DUF2628 domain-containing protein [Rhodospirillales bacterium]